jgi:hypothetical protein
MLKIEFKKSVRKESKAREKLQKEKFFRHKKNIFLPPRERESVVLCNIVRNFSVSNKSVNTKEDRAIRPVAAQGRGNKGAKYL